MNTKIKPIVLACAMALASGQAAAIDYSLAVKQYTKQLPMADGTLVDVPMWGYVIDPDNDATGRGDCYEASNTNRLACINALPDPTAPGPQLSIPSNQTALRIFLSNGLPTPTSVVIPGQELPYSATNNGPTWNDNSVGSRGTDLTKKVRSYTREAAADGGRRLYVWNNSRGNRINTTGTLMYHSGTNPQLQVYMGLYGAVTKDAAAGEVYPGVTYDNDVTLFYSEIDLAHNEAVAAGGTGYTPIEYHPSWFLINGEPYVDGSTPNIAAGVAGESTLIRFLSAASEKHVPVFQGLSGTIHAEDGIQYTWQNAGVVGGTAPREQYSVGLPPLKTKDVIINPGSNGEYAVYDGNGYMTNPSNPDDPTDGGDAVGGMLRFLEVGAAAVSAPIAVADSYTATEETLLSIPAAGVLTNDTAGDGGALPATAQVQLVLPPANGSLTLNADGSFDYTPNLDVDTSDSFTYEVLDTATSLTSNVATVSIGITGVNDAPTIVSTPVTAATVGELFSYDVDATDPDTGDVLTYSLDAASLTAGLTIDPNTGVINWTPTVSVVQPVTVTVTDSALATATQAFNINVADVVAETPPVAAGDAYSVNEDAILDVAADGVLGNDTATDGDAMIAVLMAGPSCAWTDGPSGAAAFVLNDNGSFHYEPIPNWNSSLAADNPFCNGVTGPDSFTYVARDKDGDSSVVTVELTVNEMNDAPVAVNDTLTMTAMDSFTFPVPDVAPADDGIVNILENDGDVDLIPFDPAQIFAVRESNPNRGSITGWPLNGDETDAGADGSFTFNFTGRRIGNIASFTYHATDTLADSNTATITIRRELSIQKAECEVDTENGVCGWAIQGRISGAVPNGSVIEARLVRTDQVIGTHVETGGAGWTIEVQNAVIPQPGDVIDVRVITNLSDPQAAKAFILNFPVTVN